MLDKDDQDLQLLDRQLRDRDSSLSLYDWQGHATLQLMAHHPQSAPLYKDGFNELARGLVEKNEGQFLLQDNDGFAAAFPSEQKREDFVRAFAAAAKAAYPAERSGIRNEHGTLKLGAYGP